jgi:hypothetical protein
MTSAKEKRDKLTVAHWFVDSIYTDQKVAVRGASKELLNHIYTVSNPARKHPKRHLPQVEIFLLNLLMAYHCTDGVMAISKSSGSYTNDVSSYRVTVELIVNTLIKSGWLIEHRGFHGGITGCVTRLELTTQFASWLDASDLDMPQTKVKQPSKPIVLKDVKKNVITAPEYLKEEVALMEAKVTFLNTQLGLAHIDLAVSNDELELINTKMKKKAIEDSTRESYLFLAKKYLQRKFNNGTLEDGGRFYDAWWITIPKEWRKYITINGHPTVELDYTGMHLQMLYAKEGIDKLGDPYEIEGVDDQFRGVTKLMFIMIFNAESRESAEGAIKASSKIKTIRNNKHPKGIKNFDQYLSLLERKYSVISQYFYSGHGVKLQSQDSSIVENVMLRMLKEHQAITLPIHDSLIVDARYKEQLHDCMLEEFKTFTGATCEVKQKPIADYDSKRLESLKDGYVKRGLNVGIEDDLLSLLKS